MLRSRSSRNLQEVEKKISSDLDKKAFFCLLLCAEIEFIKEMKGIQARTSVELAKLNLPLGSQISLSLRQSRTQFETES